jgi:rhomboid family GlyGly-CTERM serine protease
MRRAPLCTCALALAALVASLPAFAPELEYTRALIASEPWRAFTSHFTHWSSTHLIWDWLAFVALGISLEHHSRARLVALLMTAALAIPAALFAIEPELTHYRGLSGLDSALFGMAWVVALQHARSTNHPNPLLVRLLGLLGFGFALKICWELLLGDAFFMPNDVGFEPVPLAHAIGAVLGVTFGSKLPLKNRYAEPEHHSTIASANLH